MSNLIDKLKQSQCGCDQLTGKTIAKSIRERGFYYLLFTDGTWCCTREDLGVREVFEMNMEIEDDTHPFVRMGLATTEDLLDYALEMNENQREFMLRMERATYEKLKAKFEPSTTQPE